MAEFTFSQRFVATFERLGRTRDVEVEVLCAPTGNAIAAAIHEQIRRRRLLASSEFEVDVFGDEERIDEGGEVMVGGGRFGVGAWRRA